MAASRGSGAIRVLGFIVAVGLIFGALQFRNRGAEVAGPTTSESPSATAPTLESGAAIHVVCATELAEACEAMGLDVSTRVESAVATYERLVALPTAPEDLHAWVTMAPWPEMVDEARVRAGRAPLFTATDLAARSPIVAAAFTSRADVLELRCGGATLACIGAASSGSWQDIGGQANWGRIQPGLPDPQTSALGLVTLAQGAVEVTGSAALSTRDQSTDIFLDWIGALAPARVASITAASPVTSLLSLGVSRVQLVATTEADVASVSNRIGADRLSDVRVTYASPAVTADAVIAMTRNLGNSAVTALAAEGLAASGWRTGAFNAPLGAPLNAPQTLETTNGLPSPGAMEALRGSWQQASRG